MKKSTMCNPNHGCRDVQLKNTIDGFNQLISTYNRLSVCSTKSDGDQLWKELTGGITLFRRTISKLESKAFGMNISDSDLDCITKRLYFGNITNKRLKETINGCLLINSKSENTDGSLVIRVLIWFAISFSMIISVCLSYFIYSRCRKKDIGLKRSIYNCLCITSSSATLLLLPVTGLMIGFRFTDGSDIDAFLQIWLSVFFLSEFAKYGILLAVRKADRTTCSCSWKATGTTVGFWWSRMSVAANGLGLFFGALLCYCEWPERKELGSAEYNGKEDNVLLNTANDVKCSICGPNNGCRDVQIKNTIDEFTQLVSTYDRLSGCSTKSDGDQLGKELTDGITLFRRTISKLESKAFDHLSRRFSTTCVVKDNAPTLKSASSTSLSNNATPVMSTTELSQHAIESGKSTMDPDSLSSPQPKYTVMKDKDGAIVAQQSTPVQTSPARPFEPHHQKRTGEAIRNKKVDGWGDPIAGSTDLERSRSPVLNKADIVDFPEPLITSIVQAPMSRPSNADFEEDDDNFCSTTLTESTSTRPSRNQLSAGDLASNPFARSCLKSSPSNQIPRDENNAWSKEMTLNRSK